MQITLPKAQREIFKLSREHEGSYFRIYRKALHHKREYYRLMTADCNPVKNISIGKMKRFFRLGVMDEIDVGCVAIKKDIVLIEKERKQKIKK